MGLVFGATDFSTSYGFEITRQGIDIGSPELINGDFHIPGVDGVFHVNPELGARQIGIRGYIIQASAALAHTALVGLVSQLDGSLSTHADPTNFLVPTRVEKDLTLPSWDGRKFPNCKCLSWRVVRWVGGTRQGAKIIEFEMRFSQSKPQTVTV